MCLLFYVCDKAYHERNAHADSTQYTATFTNNTIPPHLLPVFSVTSPVLVHHYMHHDGRKHAKLNSFDAMESHVVINTVYVRQFKNAEHEIMSTLEFCWQHFAALEITLTCSQDNDSTLSSCNGKNIITLLKCLFCLATCYAVFIFAALRI